MMTFICVAPFLYIVKGLNATFKYFERKLRTMVMDENLHANMLFSLLYARKLSLINEA